MNENKVNIYELAEASGFSVSTVSKALNNTGRISEKTRQHIMNKAAEMNYVASYYAKALSEQKSWLIAVIFPDNLYTGFSHPYFSVILEHFKRRIEAKGYELTFINRNMGNQKMSYLEFCRYRKVEGVFMVSSYQKSRQINELIESGIAAVASDAGFPNVPTITSDDYQGGRLATEYLLNLGHEDILHLSGPTYTTSGKRRNDGFKDVMAEHGFKNPKIHEADNYAFNDGYYASLELIEKGDLPSAIFAGGDLIALGAIKAFQQKGYRVPEDISIIGYDDLEYVKYVNPALTTVSQMKKEIGFACADYLISKIEGKEAELTTLDIEVVERETCAKRLK